MLTCPNCGEKVSSPSDLTARLATCRCGAEFPIAAEATMLPQAPAPQTSSPVPEIDVPGYQILNPIGSGGMGTVYQAVQQSLGRKVAIKVLPKDLASDPHFVSRFEREAAALAQLSHPNIVNIIDRGQAGAIFYFVMELIEARSGGPSSLRELIDKGLLAPEQVTGYACQIAGALTAAHAKGIIHRDIKPSNVLVDETGNARVVDFGIAQLIQGGPDAQPQLTLAGSAIGTPRYMSPEQRQDGSSADARSDIYSLGFVLYEMLTGLIPEGVFELPSELGHDPAWDEIIEKAIRRNPDLRYPSMQEFLRALEALRGTASDLTVTSAPAPLEGTSGGTYSTPPEDSCHDCNHPNPPENRFCASCGVNLFEPCPVCAGDNRLGLSFCGSCGGNLSDLKQVHEIGAQIEELLEDSSNEPFFEDKRKLCLEALKLAHSLEGIATDEEALQQRDGILAHLSHLWDSEHASVEKEASRSQVFASLRAMFQDLPNRSDLGPKINALEEERANEIEKLKERLHRGDVQRVLNIASNSPWKEDPEIAAIVADAQGRKDQVNELMLMRIPKLREDRKFMELEKALRQLDDLGVQVKGIDKLRATTASTVAKAKRAYQRAKQLEKDRRLGESHSEYVKALELASDYSNASKALEKVSNQMEKLRKYIEQVATLFQAGDYAKVDRVATDFLLTWEHDRVRHFLTEAKQRISDRAGQRRRIIFTLCSTAAAILIAGAIALYYHRSNQRKIVFEAAFSSKNFDMALKLARTREEISKLNKEYDRYKKFQAAVERKDVTGALTFALGADEKRLVAKLREAVVEKLLLDNKFSQASDLADTSFLKKRVAWGRKERVKELLDDEDVARAAGLASTPEEKSIVESAMKKLFEKYLEARDFSKARQFTKSREQEQQLAETERASKFEEFLKAENIPPARELASTPDEVRKLKGRQASLFKKYLSTGDYENASRFAEGEQQRQRISEALKTQNLFLTAIEKQDLQSASKFAVTPAEKEKVIELRQNLFASALVGPDFSAAEKLAVTGEHKRQVSEAHLKQGRIDAAEWVRQPEGLERWRGALRHFENAHRLAPDWIDPLLEAAFAARMTSDFEALGKYARTAEALVPGNCLVQCRLGDYWLYSDPGDAEKALVHYEKAVKLAPERPEGYERRGRALYQMKRFDDAIREFAEAIKLDKNHVYICQDSTNHFATFFRAACHLEMKSYDKAIKDFTAALALDPEAHYEGKDTEDTECYRLRGLAYAYKKEYALAARDYRKAIELDPDGYQGRGAKQLLLELPSRFPKKTLTIPR